MFLINSIGTIVLHGDYELSFNEDLTVGAHDIIPVFSQFQNVGNYITVTTTFTFVPDQIDPTIAFDALFQFVAFDDEDQCSGVANVSLVTAPTGMDGSVKISSSSSLPNIIFKFITPGFDGSQVYECQAVYSYAVQDPTSFAFITKWDTTIEGDATVGLPLVSDGTYNFFVHWGDGSSDHITAFDDAANTHVYDTNGVYEVQIYGQCEGWNFYDSDYGYTASIIDVLQWGTVVIGNGVNAFSFTTALTQISALDAPDLSATTSFNNFLSQSAIVNIDALNLWDTTTITDMTLCFDQSSAFEGIGIEGWNVQNVVFMTGMFRGCTAFNGNINLWVTSSLQDMSYMLAQASSFNQSVAGIDTSNVTTLEGTFQQAVSFEGIGIENWVTSNVSTLKSTFDGVDSDHVMAFNGNVSDWDVSNVTDMTQTFPYCYSFNVPLNWDTSSCTTMFQMFVECISFNQDMPNFVTAQTTVIINILTRCYAFNGDIGTWDLTGITGTGMLGAFDGASSLNNISLSSLNAPNATSYNSVFQNCTALDQDFSSWPISNITDAASMFNGVTLSTPNYNALLIAWAAGPPNDTVVFGGGNSHYDGAGVAARATLTDFYTWFITDGGTP